MNAYQILRTPLFEVEVKEGYFLFFNYDGEMKLCKIKEVDSNAVMDARSFHKGVLSGDKKDVFYVSTLDKRLNVSDMISKERKEELDFGISKNLLGVDILGNKINKNDEVLFGRDFYYNRVEASSVHDKIVKCNGTFVKLNNCLNFSNLKDYLPELFI